jgi:hypothetical protein
MARIANAITETEEHEKIEGTLEMIEAGKSILYEEPSVFAGPMGVDCDVGVLVEKVYLAMALLRPSSREPP